MKTHFSQHKMNERNTKVETDELANDKRKKTELPTFDGTTTTNQMSI